MLRRARVLDSPLGASAPARRRYVNQIASRYNAKVWITEFSCPQPSGGLAGQITYMRQVLSFMDSSPVVERCAAARLRTQAPHTWLLLQWRH